MAETHGTQARGAPSAGRPGRLLGGRYRLERLIATGGMAQVWAATDETLTRRVAVKLLHPHLAADETFIARFRAEAIAAAKLTHPSIVAIYDTCTDGGEEAIVLELVEGPTLREWLDEHGPLEPGQAAEVVAQAADALEAAHRAGIVHRDVKPANILLCADGRVKVADFGIAKAAEGSELTATGTMLGTAKYLAPEQVEGGPVDPRTDVYALGIVLYEALCGRPPFDGESDAAIALARLHRAPMRPRQVRAGVPRALEEVVLRALSRDPDDRYVSAGALRGALLGCIEPVPLIGEITPAPGHPALPPDATVAGDPGLGFAEAQRGWIVPAAVILAVAATLVVAGVLFSRTDAGKRLLDRVGESVGGSGGTTAATIASVSTFDPSPGDGAENDDEASRVIDGDAATTWSTEGYNSRALGGLKPGVGLVLTLNQVAELSELRVRAESSGWSAEVYVADARADDLAGWGEPVQRAVDLGIEASVDLGGREGAAVLIWITDLGDEPPPVHTVLAEIEIDGAT